MSPVTAMGSGYEESPAASDTQTADIQSAAEQGLMAEYA
jgi:hypothetical protein